MWIARISASSAAPMRVRISNPARHPSRGPGAPRGPDFHSLAASENPARANITSVCGMHAFRKCSILRPTPSSRGYAHRARPPTFFPCATLTTNPPRPALTPELPTLTRGQLRAANGSVIHPDHGRSSGAVDVWTMLIGPPAPHLLLTFLQLHTPRRTCSFPATSALHLPAQVALICSTSFRDWTAKYHPPRYDPAPRTSPRMRRSLERETAHYTGEICAAPENLK